MVVEAGGTGGVPASSGNCAQQELLYPLFCAGNRSLPASGSHRYLDDGKRALAGRSQTVYFVVVRFLNKAAALLFPGSQLVSMFMYVCMPLLAVTLCYQAARVLRRYRPDIWKTLNGGR